MNRLVRLSAVLFLLAAAVVVEAQPPGKVWRLGFLYAGSRRSIEETGRYRAFVEGLRELGYVEGKNLKIEARYHEGDQERFRAFAAELIQANVDVIVTSGSAPARTLQQMTTAIPIVVAVAFDPVREGLVTSLAHPGGNVTGLAALLDDVFPKHVELLKETVPNLTRLAVLSKASNAGHPGVQQRVEAVAGKLGIRTVPVEANTVTDFEPAFQTMTRERAGALVVLGDSFFVQHFQRIAALAVKHRLASAYSGREYPAAGGFMSYGPSFSDNYRRIAHYVDKILKGAKPGELPFEQPTRLYLVLNAKTAKALGLTIAPSLALRADEVIQ